MTRAAGLLARAASRLRSTRAASMASVVAGTIVIAIAVYRLVAPFAAPPLAHLALERLAPRGAWTARAEQIRFHPFALAFELEGMHIASPDGDVLAEARLARVDFSFRSFALMRPVMDRLDIRGGTLRATPLPASAAALWSLLRTLSTRARIAELDAELTEVALAPPNAYKAVRNLALHGTGIDFGAARGSFEVNASYPLGDGSRLERREGAACPGHP